MRIVCQKCSAAYAIEDRLITPKGVRAQCPRCRHLQLVKKDSPSTPVGSQETQVAVVAPLPQLTPAVAAPTGPAVMPPSNDGSDLFDFGSPPPGLPPFPKDASLFGTDATSEDTVVVKAPKGMTGLGTDPGVELTNPGTNPGVKPGMKPGSDPLFDFLGPPLGEPEGTSPGLPSPAPLRPASAGAASGAPAPRALSLPDFAAVSTPGSASPGEFPAVGAAAAAADPTCRECGKPLMDSFDQALGRCDACRERAENPPRPSSREPRIEAPPALALASPAADAPATPAPAAEPRAPRAAAPRPVAQPSMAARSAQRPGGKGALLGGVAAVLLLGGGGAYYALFHMPRQDATAPTAQASGTVTASSALPEAVQAVLPRWQLQYLDLEGTSAELLAQGSAQLQKDQRFAYAEAEESFQQALLADPRSDAAIAGYVQALALGRGVDMDDASFEEAQGLIEAAESRAGRTPALVLAHANLLLSRPRQPQNLDKARQLAERVLGEGTPPEKAEAHLVLGRAFLSSSMGLANQHFDSALQLAPDLRRVHYYRALAYASVGEYAQALEGLKKRLELDPRHWDSLEATGRIYLELGEGARARKVYEERLQAEPKDFRAQLALAAMRYQTGESASGAAKELQALLKNRSSLGNRDVAEALVHLAIAERLAGNADAATKAATEALALEKGHTAAHLQLFLVAMGRGDAAKAGTHLAALKGQLEDAALLQVLEGRLLMLEGKHSEAVARFQEAVKLDDRRHDALLLAGVASAKQKKRDEAFRPLFQALESDPLSVAPSPLATLRYVRPQDTLKGTEGAIIALVEGSEDVVPRLYEGLLRFHLGDLAAAERFFKQALEVDADNAHATSYLTFIALKRGNKAAARAQGERAVAAGRRIALTHLAQGMALAEAKQVEPAKKALREALALAPKLLAAEVKLAELEADSDRDSARTRLVKVVGLDPTYHTAKRVLFLLDKRG